MPGMDYVFLTPTELTLWREKATPTVLRVTNLLLRGGAMGYLDMKDLLHKSSEEDSNISKDKRRVNPVALKAVLNGSGVLLTPDEYKVLRTAYSDEGGFLVDEFLDFVRPSRRLSDHAVGVLQDICLHGGSGSCMILLDDILCTLGNALMSDDVLASSSSLLESALLEIQVVFTSSRYPTGRVPPQDVVDFFAALLLNTPEISEPLLKCIARVQLSSPSSLFAYEEEPVIPNSRSSRRTERGYEYYTDTDNRDQWIRGREEAPPRPTYMRHLPGYQGHMPTYCSKFGRSFHPIEESMPDLSHPKQPLEPLSVDRWGSGVELKGSRMNQHNFKLA